MATRPVLQQDWSDHAWFVGSYLPKQTVLTLRAFANVINDRITEKVFIRSSDRKVDVVNRVQDAFQRMKANGNLRGYAEIRLACELLGSPIQRLGGYQGPPPTFGGVPAASSSSSSSYVNRPAGATGMSNGYAAGAGGYSAAGPSRTSANNWSSSTTATAYSRPSPTLLDWKPNPMWKPIKALTSMESLPDKLNYTREHPNASPRYAIRLFCTSSDYYRPPGMPLFPGQIAPTNRNLPIEFPSNPDCAVDNYGLTFKEKGLRGKAGSAPPFDLEKGPNGLSRVPNRPTYVTMGHSGPTVGKKKDQAKRFFYQVVFTEMTPKEELLRRLSALEPTNAEASLAEFRKRQEEDDDIIVGTSVMSLKDPLSYMRITRPVRSSRCTHMQCFDATWWVESNAQHPQWLCPLCNKELQFPDLIVDGYVLSILNAVPDSFDDVVLEPTGDWHTEDNKFGSAVWMAENGVAPPPDAKPEVAPSPQSNDSAPTGDVGSNAKRKFVEIVLSDSEDDDEEEEERPLASRANGSKPPPPPPTSAPPPPPPRLPPTAPSSTAGPSSARSSVQPVNEIIDLTLSDSEDDDDAETQEEQPSASQTYFQNPGSGYATQNAVDSRPPLPSQNDQGRPAVRAINGGNVNGMGSGQATSGLNAAVESGRGNLLYNMNPHAAGGSGTGGIVRPPPAPRTGSSSSYDSGSVSKRPRAETSLNGPPTNRMDGPPTFGGQVREPMGPGRGNGGGPQAQATHPLSDRAFASYAESRQSGFRTHAPPPLAPHYHFDPPNAQFHRPASGHLQPSMQPRYNSSSPLASPHTPTIATSSPLAPRDPALARYDHVLSPGQANMWVKSQNRNQPQSQNQNRVQGQGQSSAAAGTSGIRDKDADEASLELNPRSTIVSPVSPPNNPQSPVVNQAAKQPTTTTEPKDKVTTEADAERSSDLGIGIEADGGPDYLGLDIGGVENEFWEGVLLNGDEIDG
ncbi:hypothetical protein IAU59_004412 [Kwoniella sp. CBS 9459]